MTTELNFSFKTIAFNEHYQPGDNTRLTTNFANLARGEFREQNLRNTLSMINNRFNALAHWDNPNGNRYSVDVDIASFDIDINGNGHYLPLIEMLKTTVIDTHTKTAITGMFGNSFSSYVRDYDFSVLQQELKNELPTFNIGEEFGDLHGKLFKALLASRVYSDNFAKLPVICLSVSSTKTYSKTSHIHPVLGTEYLQNEYSSTDTYFSKMGMQVRYFMPNNSAAPLAFYFIGDLCNDYTSLELTSTISVMESFQKIYRPEIYNANSNAGHTFKPSLNHSDYSLTNIAYDRVERSQLAVKQGKFTQKNFIEPHREFLTRWISAYNA